MKNHLELIKAFNSNASFAPKYKEMANIQKGYLELYVEKTGEMSSFLHNFPFGQEDITGVKNDFKIKGLFVLCSL